MFGGQFLGKLCIAGNNGRINLIMLALGLGGPVPVLHCDAAVTAGLSVQGNQSVLNYGALAQAADGFVAVIELIILIPLTK